MLSKSQTSILFLLGLSCITIIQAGLLDGRTGTLTEEDSKDIKDKIWQECKLNELEAEEKKLTPDDTEAFEKLKAKAKCAAACMLKTLGVVTLDNKLNKELLQNLDKLIPDDNLGIVCGGAESYEKCHHITMDSDECEYAYQLSKCMKTACADKKE